MRAQAERRPLRLLVVEPAGLVRDGLVLVLQDRDEVAVCDVVDSLADLVTERRRHVVDVVLLDLDSAVASPQSLEATLTWRSRNRHLRVVGLHRGLDTADVRRSRALGIDVLLERSSPLDRLLEAIHEACYGVAATRPAAGSNGSALTPRERSVLELIARGHTSREVASRLNVSPRTVENHKQRIFSRLGVQNQAQAVAVATRLGLLEGGEGPR